MRKNLLPVGPLLEKLSTLTQLQKALVIAITILVMGVGFYFLKYQDQTARVKKLRAAIADQEKKLNSLKQASIEVAALQKELEQAEEEFARLLSFLPDQKEIPGLLEKVSQLGAQVGLENILFQPQAEMPKEFYAMIPVRLDLIGTYHELGIFFDRISKLNRILKVDNVTLTRQKDSARLQVNCTVVTYRFVEKPPQPASAVPSAKKK
ncbi:MAG: type 4a pilus biogenesis protein PilO [Syntrophobacteraceae bacterium]|nr:type 4a pilus biogenesis protein PilO [Syntrophobacteraceae bacterium]